MGAKVHFFFGIKIYLFNTLHILNSLSLLAKLIIIKILQQPKKLTRIKNIEKKEPDIQILGFK